MSIKRNLLAWKVQFLKSWLKKGHKICEAEALGTVLDFVTLSG
jgi:hypothetical protein